MFSIAPKRWWFTFVTVMIVWQSLMPTAHAGMVDHDRTAYGSDMPFSTLSDVVATPWDLFNLPLTMTGNDGWGWTELIPSHCDLAEPGLGNVNHQTLGQILFHGGEGGSNVWLIFDRLAAVLVPHLLWDAKGGLLPDLPGRGIAPYLPTEPIEGLWGGGSRGGGGGGGGGGSSIDLAEPYEPEHEDPGDPPIGAVVPEPATMGCLILGGAMIAGRRRR